MYNTDNLEGYLVTDTSKSPLTDEEIAIIQKKYLQSLTITCAEINRRERCPVDAQRKRRKAYLLTMNYFCQDIALHSERKLMIGEDMRSSALRDSIIKKRAKRNQKKKKRGSNKKNVCTCSPNSFMCFCRKKNGEWVKNI